MGYNTMFESVAMKRTSPKHATTGQRTQMGKLTWEGWQTSVSDAPQPIGIVYGKNLRKPSKENSEAEAKPRPKAEAKPKAKAK
jgi:hypothetical protein